MNYSRHYSPPGRATPRPPLSPAFRNMLPFLQEASGASGHDFLVLNARPDLTDRPDPARDEEDDAVFEENLSTTAFLQRCFAGFQI